MSADVDPYKFPDLDVLRNKPGIRDARLLQAYEYRASTERMLELAEEPIAGRFDLDHLKAIHKYAFQDVYDWAGELRSVSISKGGSLFALPEYIESYGKLVFGALADDEHLRGKALGVFVDRLAHYHGEINALHPFREGNGRSTRVFLDQLAKQAGYVLDFTRVVADQWNAAARESFAGNGEPMVKLFAHVTRPVR